MEVLIELLTWLHPFIQPEVLTIVGVLYILFALLFGSILVADEYHRPEHDYIGAILLATIWPIIPLKIWIGNRWNRGLLKNF